VGADVPDGRVLDTPTLVLDTRAERYRGTSLIRNRPPRWVRKYPMAAHDKLGQLYYSGLEVSPARCRANPAERELFIDNLLVRIHFIIVMIRWTGVAPWEFEFPFPGSLTSTFRFALRCRAKSAQVSQSRPDSSLGWSHFQDKSLEHHLRCTLSTRWQRTTRWASSIIFVY